nr:V-set and transmembrane domain-containing protein 5 isoform X2 [Microcebus murinus]
MQKIVEWKPGTQANISQSHQDRVCTFDNGSIQLFSVGVRDSGYYIVTVTERPGSSQFGTIVLHVSEILYEDLHLVAVFLAFLTAVAAVLISLLWVCNKCAYKFQRKRRHKLKGNPSPLGPCGNPRMVLRLGVARIVSFSLRKRPVAGFPLTDLSFALQKAPLRRLSCKMLSVSQGWAQLHSYLKRKPFSSKRSKCSHYSPVLASCGLATAACHRRDS